MSSKIRTLPGLSSGCCERGTYFRPLGGLVAEMMSYAIRRCYGFDIETHWYIGRYVLPGNVQKVILKSKALPPCALLDASP